jgi:hypothetical protein
MLKKFLSSLSVLIILTTSWSVAHAQTPDTQYFHETGHNVSGEFLAFYNGNSNALFLFGYPITEQFVSNDGKTVQYFQRARFELNADPNGQRVLLTPLGKELYQVSGSTFNFQNFFSCRSYAETGFSVCFEFLEFFDAYGGVEQFGYPISGFEYREDRLIQYFENARIEWQPWKFEGQRVVVSDLGQAYFYQLNEDPILLEKASPINNAPNVITAMQVRTFTLKAVTLASDTQTFFIIVQDQNGTPLSNINCTAVVHWNNELSNSTVITTNDLGVGTFSIQFENQIQGDLIYADVTCSYDTLSATTSTSFRIWY